MILAEVDLSPLIVVLSDQFVEDGWFVAKVTLMHWSL
jgi:hypothetical protein